ncbi:hypothetical protein BVRB_5g123050 [Beta vulgaris subsp. vulgaris]|uniref:Uncharacterized protein n=1 Tax=Beta vulgaris subsp. vulgaris TaxID=3555 RepID=A0A0J8E442_BETVV|nr:hypothetical protein BVRB_5g123050 [Beta vulgaris subsp. vulgaris]
MDSNRRQSFAILLRRAERGRRGGGALCHNSGLVEWSIRI